MILPIVESRADQPMIFPVDEYLARQWTLPHQEITALLKRRNGRLLIATDDGLAQFDGVNFQSYRAGEYVDQEFGFVTALFEDSQGGLWIGTRQSGLFIVRNDQLIHLTEENGLSNNRIRSICEDWQGSIWVGTDFGLNEIRDQFIRTFHRRDGLLDEIISALTIDQTGRLIVGTFQGGLAIRQGGRFEQIGYREGLTNTAVLTLNCDPDGDLWIGSLAGLFRMDARRRIQRIKTAGSTPVKAVAFDDNGFIWVATAGDGLKRINKRNYSDYALLNNLPAEYLHCLLPGAQQTLWIGTENDGLIQLAERFTSTIDRSQGLPENACTAVFAGQNGTLWIATRSCGLVRYSAGKSERHGRATGLTTDGVTALCEDLRANLWAGGRDGSVIRIGSDRKMSHFGFLSTSINCIISDKKGQIWCASDSELVRVEEHTDRMITMVSALPPIKCLINGFADDLLLGTARGLYQYDSQGVREIDLPEPYSRTEIHSLRMDTDSILWIGSAGQGALLYRFRQNSGVALRGVPGKQIMGTTEDSAGYVWLSGDEGLWRFKKTAVRKILEYPHKIILPQKFDLTDGLSSPQQIPGGCPGLVSGTDGKVYMATARGVAVIDISRIPVQKDTSTLLIELTTRSGHYTSADRVIRFPSGREEIIFHLFPVPVENYQRATIACFLTGINEKPKLIRPGDSRAIRYAGLRPGHYTLMVSMDEINCPPTSQLTFTVFVPLYRHPAVLALYCMGGVVILIGTRRVLMKSQKKNQQPRYHTTRLPIVRIDEILQRLEYLTGKEKIYLNPDLTLSELSRQVRCNSNQMSRIINEHYQLNFNDYLNRLRIEHASQCLKTDQEKTLLEIMYASGFNSKSVFNQAFRKFTGLTPSAYRRQMREGQ